MKILYIYQFLSYGGVEMLLRNRAKYLKKLDPKLEINLLVLKSSISTIPSEFDNVFVCKKKRDITERISEHDLIINVDTPELFDLIEKSKRPLILETFTSAKPSRKYLKLKLPSNLQLVIVPSVMFKNIVEAEISNKDVPVKVAYNFTEKADFGDKALNINFHGARPILWIGRLEEAKGWRDALTIFSLLKRVFKSDTIELFLIGEKLDKYDKHIFEIMDDYGVLDSVRYIPRVDFKEMGAIYSQVRENKGIYLSTSKMETFGLTVLEAMSYGLPCVLNNLEIFEELYKGASMLYEDEKHASELIKDILERDSLYSELENKAKGRSSEFHNGEIIPDLYNLYKEVFLDEKNRQ